MNWVNDRNVADVHVIMTSQGTGAGGREYLMDFMGTDDESSYSDQQTYQSLPTDTDREVLDGVANTLALGLAVFANQSGYRGLASVIPLAAAQPEQQVEGMVSADEVDDPWNLWVFRLNGGAGIEGESSRSNTELEGRFTAWRTAPVWKFSISGEWPTTACGSNFPTESSGTTALAGTWIHGWSIRWPSTGRWASWARPDASSPTT